MKSRRQRLFLAMISMLLLPALACQSAWPQAVLPDAQATGSAESVVQHELISTQTALPAVVASDLFSQQEALISLYQVVRTGVVSVRVATDIGAAQGSGFVYDQLGHIVTNLHVVEGATYLEVAFPSGLKTTAEVIGVDADSDLAVLQVDVLEEDLIPLALGDSGQLQVGQTVVAIGNPFGLNGSMSTGIVSSLGRSLDSLNLTDSGQVFSAGDLIQTDAAINPGNSGGPLLNLNGEVIGISRAIRTYNFNDAGDTLNSGIGFAISVNIVKRVVPALISEGHYDYPYLGISSPSDLTLAAAEELGLQRATGAYVGSLAEGGPAQQAGVEVGDLIIGVEGEEVLSFDALISYLFSNTGPGDTIQLQILRGSEEVVIDLVLGARP